MIATIVSSGVSTVQDGGRRGLADVGVPVSGAWHRERYRLAVGLLTGRRDDGVPTVELLGGTFAMELHLDTVFVVVGPAVVSIDDHPAGVGVCTAVARRQRVRVDHRGPGPAYLAILGWQPERVLGSAATDTFSRLGPPLLAAGTVLGGAAAADVHDRVGAFHRDLPAVGGPIRVVGTGHPAAPEFVSQPWAVTATARSGLRLTGRPVAGAGNLPSAPMVAGAVQLTPSGDPVVLGPDGGLTGGYPVVAVVATVDLDRLSLAVPGDALAFRLCDPAEAATAHAERARALAFAIAHPGLLG